MSSYDLTSQDMPSTLQKGDILNIRYSGDKKSIVLPVGKYKFECWGAQGGNGYVSVGCRGGYSVGTLTLTEDTLIHVYVGGQGGGTIDCTSNGGTGGGFNGGGNVNIISGTYSNTPYAGAGGGASDIRIKEDSIYARVIVAGGGGGASNKVYGAQSYSNAGFGGGIWGGPQSTYEGKYYNNNNSATTSLSEASNAYMAGQSRPATAVASNGEPGVIGEFFKGADGKNSASYAIARGGGGWYGGSSSCWGGYGGGGSGYVYTSETAPLYPSGCLLDSKYYLSKASTVGGNTSFTDTTGESTTGRFGHGAVRITFVRPYDPNEIPPTIYDLNTVDSLPTLNTNDVILCNYSGSMKNIELPAGKYALECWGAQGGGKQLNSALGTANGGKGGYSYGELTLNEPTDIYIYAGGMGSANDGFAQGGFNGGGAAYGSGISEPGCGGGGASDVRIGIDHLYARVIVAGGGGGGGEDASDVPGYGGGIQGGASSGMTTVATQQSTGTGGSFGYGANTNYDGGGGGGGWYGGGTTNGSSSIPTSSSTNDTSGGAGGSGYVFTAATDSYYPSGKLLYDEYYLENANTYAGNVSFTNVEGNDEETGHEGNGVVKITVLEIKSYKPFIPTATFDIDNVPKQILTGYVINCDYSGEVKTLKLDQGTYQLECWGAMGGYRSDATKAGRGGYTKGMLKLIEPALLYLYTGGSGNSGGTNGGFNGGGERETHAGGGGASDIRINTDSLYARIIVAGGGGSDGCADYAGGHGGGLKGISATVGCGTGGQGGTQTAGGEGSTSNSSTKGAFGQGGKGLYNSSGYGGAGGGGWYGGAGCYPDGSSDDDKGGGGGSGYVYTESTAANYPSRCLLNENFYLTQTKNIDGGLPFKDPDGTMVYGHEGNGFIRISAIDAIVKLDGTVAQGNSGINKLMLKQQNIKSVLWCNNLFYGKYNKKTYQDVNITDDDNEGHISIDTIDVLNDSDGVQTINNNAFIIDSKGNWMIF